ncbi:uncharacterized protein Z518_02900 [Rhinocladiella mackenziei CBS 650.93]|uniref:tRNA-splicing endonuclease subunit Sen54 N-terminal domain-containing protein n=1 Tax=Rhinocladiella mackenziei CBS 650.93 TaxID=1442369 RepID=A0A0D2IQL2_9EURO|nr:uncharacterized protein Z518_02900 [Rhinocladiella mackenziei CBS 650.93]KIX08244.1 hypothetical protein Z518_02900 [Rhinocladiella mackenziei CBS 650.93]
MSDADEDAIPTQSASGPEDLEDETQDFRFLVQLTSSTTGQAIIPKRGTKDFEPNPTRSQASALDASRLAMHTALSAVRTHSGRNHLLGQYLPDEDDWRWDDDGAGVRYGRCVVVYKFKSTHLKVMGQADRKNWIWFLPEEALYLLERGSLDIRWPDVDENDGAAIEGDTHDAVTSESQTTQRKEDVSPQQPSGRGEGLIKFEQDPKVGELPMSLQGAYASFIGKDGLTLERYSVYASLKRLGYVVQRAPTWHDNDPPPANGHVHLQPPSASATPATTPSATTVTLSKPRVVTGCASLVYRLISRLFQAGRGESCPALGPLVAPGLYRNYAGMFRALALIPYHDSSIPSTSSNPVSRASPNSIPVPRRNPPPPFRIHFHVWKPSSANTYRKSAPPPPDYRIAVVDARTTSVPTLSQINALLDSQPDDALPRDKAGRMETRIKHGRRNVLLAVVDMGVISYLRLSDACFGAEKLFEEKVKTGSKGKGRGGGGRKGQGQKQGN